MTEQNLFQPILLNVYHLFVQANFTLKLPFISVFSHISRICSKMLESFKANTQPTFTCSKAKIETLEKGVKQVQSQE